MVVFYHYTRYIWYWCTKRKLCYLLIKDENNLSRNKIILNWNSENISFSNICIRTINFDVLTLIWLPVIYFYANIYKIRSFK